MTTGRINQVTIFRAPAPGDTRSRPRGAPRLAGRSRAERFSIETRPTRGANPARRPCCVAPPRPPRALRARSEARKAPSLEARLCEFLPGRSSDPKGDSPRRGEERVPHPGGRKPFPQADPQRRRFPTAPRSPSVTLGRRAAGPYQLAAGYYACTTCIGTSSSSAATHPSAREGAAHRARSSRSARSL